MSAAESYQPYVEDYDSVISEVVPLTRRHTATARGKSGLANETSMSSSYDGVSDSGYSSANAPSPNIESPPLKSKTPAVASTTPASAASRKDALKRASTPGTQRPSSTKAPLGRTASPAVPRTIPNAKPRERSPTMPSTGGADECDCADCKKDTEKKASPSSPSIAWPLQGSYHGAYTHSPTWAGYPYPPTRYDGYALPTDSGVSDSSRDSDRKRSSMPLPPRPSSTFSGSTASSYPIAYGNYFGHASSPAPAPPTPSSTCPPGAFSAYAPPPLNTSVGPSSSPASYSPYGSTIPPYGGPYGNLDSWGRSPTTIVPSPPFHDYSMPPPPQLTNSTSKRRNTVRAQTNLGVAYQESDDFLPHSAQPHQRRSSRTISAERPPSWISAPYRDMSGLDRSMSVPPGTTVVQEPVRRKPTTPGPTPSRRRESGHSQGTSGQLRLGPSALSRAMESCAIMDDVPTVRNHGRSHSDYYYSHHGQLAHRDPSTMMQHTNSDSGSSKSGGSHHEELVQMTVPDSDGETFTMRYPAGIPVKLSLNGGAHRTIAVGHKDKKESIEHSVAYRYVQERQQQVHAQLQYGALEHSGRKASPGDYSYRSTGYGRRATLSGAVGL